MKIDKTRANEIGADVRAALKQVAEKHGLEFRPKPGRYSEADFRGSFEFVDREGAAKAESQIASLLGYKVKVGDPVVLSLRRFVVSSITPRGKVSIKDSLGKTYTVRRPESLAPATEAELATAKA